MHTDRFFFSVLTDGRKTKKEFADFLRSGEQNEPQPVRRGRGRDEGRRGAKVRDKRMSDSAEHLQDNVRVWILSFADIREKSRSCEIQLKLKSDTSESLET